MTLGPQEKYDLLRLSHSIFQEAYDNEGRNGAFPTLITHHPSVSRL